MPRPSTWLRTLLTQHASPARIAGGVALGLALSLVPIPFAGMTVALALAPLLRLNLPATYAGSAIVNPVTGPFFYFAEYWVGTRVRGRTPPSWSDLAALDAAGWWTVFRQAVPDFLAGAAVVCLAAAPVAFALTYVAVRVGRTLLGLEPAGTEADLSSPHEEGRDPPEPG
ncbi:MAG: DUF2062 domain-containing protein [Deltaproteobacteria bacterium]|nr:MAG: DUF2062 domain-containing protein [Deltaproteobacteria bacterium]